jgi:glycogen operon protein
MISAIPHSEDADPSRHHVMMMCHAGTQPQEFRFPDAAKRFRWQLFLDTAAPSPNDIFPDFDGPRAETNKSLTLESLSMRVYLAEIDK